MFGPAIITITDILNRTIIGNYYDKCLFGKALISNGNNVIKETKIELMPLGVARVVLVIEHQAFMYDFIKKIIRFN